MADESIIKLSVEEWDHDQRIAVARVAAQSLTQVAPLLGEPWSSHWWNDVIKYLQVTQQELEGRYMTYQQAVDLLSGEKRDIRIEVMVDLLALALHVTPNAMKEDAKKSKAKHVMLYDARSRRFLLELEHALNLYMGDLVSVEKSVAQQMYYGMLEQQEKQQEDGSPSMQQNMDLSARKAIEGANKKKQAFRWIATGAGIIGGGAVIGKHNFWWRGEMSGSKLCIIYNYTALTGGLAAPLLAPLLVGVTGATFFATAGGVALVTSLFGLTGGGLAGWKMHKRMKGIEEFEFKQILNDPDLPPVPALRCTICISGFLLDSKQETRVSI